MRQAWLLELGILSWVSCNSVLAFAEAPVTKPDAAYVNELNQRFSEIASREHDVMELLNEAIAKAHLKTSLELISQVSYCDDAGSRAAGVIQRKETQSIFLARDLEEPPESQLKSYYLTEYRQALPPEAGSDPATWAFGPDVLVVTRMSDSRQICIKPGFTPENAVELLAHELVHYAHSPEVQEIRDSRRLSDLDSYSTQTIAQPGDEFDAYVMQFSLTIRLRGKTALAAPVSIAQSFSDRGEFTGRREEMNRYILDYLDYRNKRFKTEYTSALELEIQMNGKQLEVEKELLQARQKQVTDLKNVLQGRYRLLDFVLSSYRATSERYRKLLKSAEDSITRLTRDIQERTEWSEELKRHKP